MAASKKHAIKMALFRLGMQARPKEVVDALAEQGIFVSVGLVRSVKFEMTEELAVGTRNKFAKVVSPETGGDDRTHFRQGIFQEDDAMQRNLKWRPSQPPRTQRSPTAMPPSFKAEVEVKAKELVESVLKPRYVKPKPKKPKFNYIIDVETKWLGSKLYFIATLACARPARAFEWRFARMEHFGYQRFALSFMRHNDKWVRLYHGRTVDECLEAIRDEPWFQLA